ncbi:MAG TPA: hypothetical protein VF339_17335 [Gammaproteobacteria bacterium]
MPESLQRVPNEQHDKIRDQAAKILASGALGRSRSYARLLEFLVDCTLEGRTPKEHEIATSVFNRGPDFDPGQDSMVRVYAHHLRQKLDNYYSTAGRGEAVRIVVPKGEYRVALATLEAEEAPDEPPASEPSRARRAPWAVAAIAAAAAAIGIGLGWWLAQDRSPPSPVEAVAASDIWSPILADDTPTLIVVGDYYIFGELDEVGNVDRLIRNFSINSSKDLDEYLMFDPNPGRYIDLDLTYLPRSTAFALRDLLRVLYTSDKPVAIASMSELDAADLRENHIIYVGYISALDKLYDFMFDDSGLTVGETFDEVIERKTGKLYVSGGGMPSASRNYRDYGLFATFPGPGGNQFMVVAGTRDAGLMQTAYALGSLRHVRALEEAAPERSGGDPLAFEVLYEVSGLDRTNLDAVIVYAAAR